jgi:hypothetical protein
VSGGRRHWLAVLCMALSCTDSVGTYPCSRTGAFRPACAEAMLDAADGFVNDLADLDGLSDAGVDASNDLGAGCDGTVCDGGCVDTRSDPNHCGACGAACGTQNATARCEGGVCRPLCNAGWGNCDGNGANGCEQSLAEVAHCGSCGNACVGSATQVASCDAGMCTLTCQAGRGDCDREAANGCEVDLTASVAHCGSCGAACSSEGVAEGTLRCVMGACQFQCVARTRGDCDGNARNGCETVTFDDMQHCGACGSVCSSMGGLRRCSDGVCCVDLVRGACSDATPCCYDRFSCRGGVCLLRSGQPCTDSANCVSGECRATDAGMRCR